MEGGLHKYTSHPHPTGTPPAYQDGLNAKTSVNDYYNYMLLKIQDELTGSAHKIHSESSVSDELDTTDQTPLNPLN